MLKRLETIIANCDTPRFAEEENDDLRLWYAIFVHEYTINATDVKTSRAKMVDLQEPKNILDILTANLEAFVVLVMVNNIEVWVKNSQIPPGSSQVRERGGRWTKVTKKKKVSGEGQNDGSSPSVDDECEDDICLKFERGWEREGMEFYKNECKFFRLIRNDERIYEEMKNKTEDHFNRMYIIPKEKAMRKRMKKRQRLAEKQSKEPARLEDGEWDGMMEMGL